MRPNELALAAEYLSDYDDMVSSNPQCELDDTAENRTLVEAAMKWFAEDQGEAVAQLVVHDGNIMTKHYILVGYLRNLLLEESGADRCGGDIARSVV